MKALSLLAAVALFALAPTSRATETDSFTRRAAARDSLGELNLRMNDALGRIAARSRSCDEEDLYAALFQDLGGFIVAKIETWARDLPGRVTTRFNDSIYGGLGPERFALRPGCCAPQFRIGESHIGGDKLGHFLHSGFEMFYVVRSRSSHPIADIRSRWVRALDLWACPLRGPVVDHALATLAGPATPDRLVLELGQAQEDGGWGLELTGVKSYGDIAADLEGYRFWSNLVSGEHPYFVCAGGRFIQTRSFDWSDYASDAWDEAINCNSYVSERMTRVIERRVAKLAVREGWPSTTCPIEPARCVALARKYGELASRILHPDCLRAAGISLSAAPAPARPASE